LVGNTKALTIFPESLNEYYNYIISEYCNEPGDLEDKILELENVDITYSSSKKVIKTITDHEESDF